MTEVENANAESVTEEVPAEAAATEETQAEPSEELDEATKLRNEVRAELEKELSTKYAKLGRREQALKYQQGNFETQQTELKEAQEIAAKYTKMQELGKTDKLGVLSELGVSYDELVQAYVSGEYKETEVVNPEVRELKSQLAAITARLEKEDATRQQKVQESQATEVQAFVMEQIKSSELPLVNSMDGAMDDILAACNIIFQQTGEAPVIADVIQEAEERYQEQFEKMLGSSHGASAFENKYSAYVEGKQKDKATAGTLSNSLSPAPTPENNQQDFPGKGTKAGLKYLLEKRNNNN